MYLDLVHVYFWYSAGYPQEGSPVCHELPNLGQWSLCMFLSFHYFDWTHIKVPAAVSSLESQPMIGQWDANSRGIDHFTPLLTLLSPYCHYTVCTAAFTTGSKYYPFSYKRPIPGSLLVLTLFVFRNMCNKVLYFYITTFLGVFFKFVWSST